MNFAIVIVLLAGVQVQTAPSKQCTQDCNKKIVKRQSIEPYVPDEKNPFLIVAEDEDDLENAESSNSHDNRYEIVEDEKRDVVPLDNDIDVNDEMENGREPFIIRVPDVEVDGPGRTPEEVDNDLEEQQTRYIANGPFLIQVDDAVNADLIQPEFSPSLTRGSRNAQQLREQVARDAAELARDLARQREAQRRQQLADRAREREELRRQELEIRLQLEQQRRADELQARADLGGHSQGGQGRGKGARRAQALEEYDNYAYDGFYN